MPLELVVHIAEGASGEDSEALVSSAVRNHFGYLAESKRREFGALMARGRASLAIGLAFLALCTLIGNMLPSGGGSRTRKRVARRPLDRRLGRDVAADRDLSL